MNSADKLLGWNNGRTTVSGVITTNQALDWNMGAGLLDLNKAYDQYLSGTEGVSGGSGGSIKPLGWDLGAISLLGSNDYTFNQKLQGGTTMDVTLDWFRDRSFDPSTYEYADSGFANLNLQVWDATTDTLIATSDSEYNSVQELHFTVPQTDTTSYR